MTFEQNKREQRHAPPPLPPKKRKQSISTTKRTGIPEFIDMKKSKGMFSGNTFKVDWSNERPRHERVCFFLSKNVLFLF